MKIIVGWPYAFLAILILNAAPSGTSNVEDSYEPGDKWIYDTEMTIGTAVLTGIITYSFYGESARTVNGTEYSMYDMKYDGSLTGRGSVQGYSVHVAARISGLDSLDQKTLDLVISSSNMSMTVLGLVQGAPMNTLIWVYTKSTFSPPGGIGDDPRNPNEGQNWTKAYSVYRETTLFEDGNITKSNYSESVTETYTWLGVRTITVPAGTFVCDVIRVDDGDNVTTNWISDQVGGIVTSAYESGSSESGTQVLRSFNYTPPTSEVSLSISTKLTISAFTAVLAVVVVAAWILIRRRTPKVEHETTPAQQGSGSLGRPQHVEVEGRDDTHRSSIEKGIGNGSVIGVSRMVVKCPSCGSENPDYSVFCGVCAKDLPAKAIQRGPERSKGPESASRLNGGTTERGVHFTKLKPSIWSVLSRDYIAFYGTAIIVGTLGNYIASYANVEVWGEYAPEDVIIWRSAALMGTAVGAAIIIIRMLWLQDVFGRSVEIKGEIDSLLFVRFTKIPGRVQYVYTYQGRRYRGGMAVARRGWIKGLAIGGDVELLVDSKNPKHAILRDQFL